MKKSKPTKIYLSGPMTGKPDHNRKEFSRFAQAFRKRGFEVFNPGENKTDTREECMRRDLRVIATCDFLIVLPGWEDSRGARAEVFVASECGIPAYSTKDFVNFDPVEPVGSMDTLRKQFPHGHPRYLDLAIEEMKLHSDKNFDYASGGDPIGNFDRVAQILQFYPGFPFASSAGVAWVYALKQVDATLWGMAKGIKHKVEGLGGRLQDISCYAKLIQIMLEEPNDEPPF